MVFVFPWALGNEVMVVWIPALLQLTKGTPSFKKMFVCFWQRWVFVAVQRLSLVAVKEAAL